MEYGVHCVRTGYWIARQKEDLWEIFKEFLYTCLLFIIKVFRLDIAQYSHVSILVYYGVICFYWLRGYLLRLRVRSLKQHIKSNQLFCIGFDRNVLISGVNGHHMTYSALLNLDDTFTEIYVIITYIYTR